MAISIEAGKAFGKIQHSFIIMSHNTRKIALLYLIISISKEYKYYKYKQQNHFKFRGKTSKVFIIGLGMRHGCLLSPLTMQGRHHKPKYLQGSQQQGEVGSMEFEKEYAAKSHSNSITKQDQTKPRLNKTKITGPAKQNICRPDLACSLHIGELGWGYFRPSL